ncbi:TetR/AcrR family transcriptional regulator [Rhodococcus sp. X156]|uniref:TetR/AcrR family transcriptional regulator n=1 Tax=Rhodococcus sp. X156 TaxID=2499145 RepID=UPI000FDB90ED|nr:TetR/AcrR family transcriptional regulator [Rhodococcus sp. X156]
MSTHTSTPPRRRDAAATREELLTAARARFAEQGYGGTTLRQVAGDVGVNPALVIRYFDSKERLFVEALGPRPHFGDVTDVPLDRLGPELVRRAIVELRSGQSGESLLALLHSQSTELGMSRLRTVIVEDFADVLGARLPGAQARARAVLVGAQLLGLSLVTEVFRRPGDALMPIEEVVAMYGPAVQALIDHTGPTG